MTVSYNATVASATLTSSLILLLRWKASLYKLLWREYILFITLFFSIMAIHKYLLTTEQNRVFYIIVQKCNDYTNLIPIAFLLGFYVSVIVSRWWSIFVLIPWPDRMAVCLLSNLNGTTQKARLMRRTIIRYFCLALTISLASMSTAVKKRFPTLDHLIAAGLMTTVEQDIIEDIDTNHNKFFVPFIWAASLLVRARDEGLINNDLALKALMDELNTFRTNLRSVMCYDWVNIPLVYTQVVSLAVYTFFITCLIGRQNIILPEGSKIDDNLSKHRDFTFPIFTSLQFIFYMGWLKVAECMLNPFGEDDDDFDVNYIIDRNLQVCYLIVDEINRQSPELIKDQHWDEVNFVLPYTEATKHLQDKQPFLGSTLRVSIHEKMAEIATSNYPSESDLFVQTTPKNRHASAIITGGNNTTTASPAQILSSDIEKLPLTNADNINKQSAAPSGIANNYNYNTTRKSRIIVKNDIFVQRAPSIEGVNNCVANSTTSFDENVDNNELHDGIANNNLLNKDDGKFKNKARQFLGNMLNKLRKKNSKYAQDFSSGLPFVSSKNRISIFNRDSQSTWRSTVSRKSTIYDTKVVDT